ncbi:MAG: MBL fold metallo-hydrolase [Desulfotignum sp.]|nr:MBL fold metallo-hydrolase [Desulfotignum sp.]MCF8125913.1 MBL fold metallo-hydrolase [Desulfotignum sp.]
MADKMQITVLGSGTCVPSLERYPCSILIKGSDTCILTDAGPGILGQVLKTGTSIHEIDMILLSHFHVDHCADLAPFLFASKYPKAGRAKKLTLAGGTGIQVFFQRLCRTFEDTIRLSPDLFEICELPETGSAVVRPAHSDDPENTGIHLAWAAMAHKPESRAFRFTDSTGFCAVYSGDTDYNPALVDLASDADLLICESAMPDGCHVPGHLTPGMAGKIAASAQVRQLVLTHFYPECENANMKAQAQKTFEGPVVLARDLLHL